MWLRLVGSSYSYVASLTLTYGWPCFIFGSGWHEFLFLLTGSHFSFQLDRWTFPWKIVYWTGSTLDLGTKGQCVPVKDAEMGILYTLSAQNLRDSKMIRTTRNPQDFWVGKDRMAYDTFFTLQDTRMWKLPAGQQWHAGRCYWLSPFLSRSSHTSVPLPGMFLSAQNRR